MASSRSSVRLSRRSFVHAGAMAAGALSVPALMQGCNRTEVEEAAPAAKADDGARFRLITLDPGHFHSALVQKSMYPDVSPIVHVYAPEGDELRQHVARIDSYNARADKPTDWDLRVYTGADFLERMLSERNGNIVVIAGNNARKTE